MRFSITHTTVFALPMLMLTGSGCMTQSNDIVSLSPEVSLFAFDAGMVDGESAELVSDEPTLTGLDRSAWRQTTVVVPASAIWSKPTYARPLNLAQSMDRQRGTYPSATSALGLEDPHFIHQGFEAVTSPVAGVIDLVLMPLRAAMALPWQDARYPVDQLQLSPGLWSDAEQMQSEPDKTESKEAEPLGDDENGDEGGEGGDDAQDDSLVQSPIHE